ncbi:MAG: hypothetical protein ACI9TV_002414 [Sulfurimonas sp.]|jgi:hypothetical protein|uniref:hypothetical protein n=1 Tax=Sulfurimonas sp. TaxID=2022749 RepID=UPI0039E68958
MCNFNKQNKDTKAFIHLFMKKASENVGGTNFLLALIEAMKTKKPNALMYKEKQVSSNNTIIKWNKVVFKDKVDVLEEILLSHRSSEDPDFNILNNENIKKRKLILNMVKTLTPLEFVVTPQNPNDGAGFNFKAFDVADEDNVKVNPIFIAMFFCSTEFTKKALKYEI